MTCGIRYVRGVALGPDDVLVVQFDQPVDIAHAQVLTQQLEEKLAPNKVLVLGNAGVTLGKISREVVK